MYQVTAGQPVENAWCREARKVLELAARRAVTLDRETMVLSDVRDLQRLAEWLRGEPRAPGRWRRRPC